MVMVKGVIFDFDGTIVDSIDALWRSFNAGVKVFHLKTVVKGRLMGLMNEGHSLAEILRRIYPELRAESALGIISGIMDEIKNDYLAQGMERVRFSDGAEELLVLLKARGLRMGIVTSRTSSAERVWDELEHRRMRQFIDAVVTGAESRRKPAPDAVIKCLKRLNLSPGESVFIGDSQADIRAGKAAGVRTVAVATGVSAREGLEAESPDFVFDNLNCLIEKLDFILNGG
jgi:phosphoglycolate phosphatase/pyrophosphatase PpaX